MHRARLAARRAPRRLRACSRPCPKTRDARPVWTSLAGPAPARRKPLASVYAGASASREATTSRRRPPPRRSAEDDGGFIPDEGSRDEGGFGTPDEETGTMSSERPQPPPGPEPPRRPWSVPPAEGQRVAAPRRQVPAPVSLSQRRRHGGVRRAGAPWRRARGSRSQVIGVRHPAPSTSAADVQRAHASDDGADAQLLVFYSCQYSSRSRQTTVDGALRHGRLGHARRSRRGRSRRRTSSRTGTCTPREDEPRRGGTSPAAT